MVGRPRARAHEVGAGPSACFCLHCLRDSRLHEVLGAQARGALWTPRPWEGLGRAGSCPWYLVQAAPDHPPREVGAGTGVWSDLARAGLPPGPVVEGGPGLRVDNKEATALRRCEHLSSPLASKATKVLGLALLPTGVSPVQCSHGLRGTHAWQTSPWHQLDPRCPAWPELGDLGEGCL